MKFTVATVVLPLFLAYQAAAICPGFNYGIGNVQNLGNGVNRCKIFLIRAFKNDWRLIRRYFFVGSVYDDNCNQVDGLTTTKNPCTQGIFGCTSSPITFNRYTSTFSGLMLVDLPFTQWINPTDFMLFCAR
jgi:hypothetical protein